MPTHAKTDRAGDVLGRPVTLRDVAIRCGVSVATVSSVVNDAAWVKDSTRERVQQALREMGYQPNQLARGLRLQRSSAVGVVASDLTNPFWAELVRRLSHTFARGEHGLLLCDADHQVDLGRAHVRRLLGEQIGGLVILGDTVPADLLRELVARGRMPLVAIEGGTDVEGMNCLLVDSEQGAYTATRHLIQQGYRRIAMIGGPSAGPGSTTHARARRYEGWGRALREAGRLSDPRLHAEGNFRLDGGAAAMRRLLALDDRPDAVFAANDMMALGALQVLREAGLRVPEDVALVGFDDIPMASLTTPALSTMRMPVRELARSAAALLEAQTQGAAPRPVLRHFAAELVVRGSSVARHDPRTSTVAA